MPCFRDGIPRRLTKQDLSPRGGRSNPVAPLWSETALLSRIRRTHCTLPKRHRGRSLCGIHAIQRLILSVGPALNTDGRWLQFVRRLRKLLNPGVPSAPVGSGNAGATVRIKAPGYAFSIVFALSAIVRAPGLLPSAPRPAFGTP
jgi:hypothetical protein